MEDENSHHYFIKDEKGDTDTELLSEIQQKLVLNEILADD